MLIIFVFYKMYTIQITNYNYTITNYTQDLHNTQNVE